MTLADFKTEMRAFFRLDSSSLGLPDGVLENIYNESLDTVVNNLLKSENLKELPIVKTISHTTTASDTQSIVSTGKLLWIDDVAEYTDTTVNMLLKADRATVIASSISKSLLSNKPVYYSMNDYTSIKIDKSLTAAKSLKIKAVVDTDAKDKVANISTFDVQVFETGKELTRGFLNLYGGEK